MPLFKHHLSIVIRTRYMCGEYWAVTHVFRELIMFRHPTTQQNGIGLRIMRYPLKYIYIYVYR